MPTTTDTPTGSSERSGLDMRESPEIMELVGVRRSGLVSPEDIYWKVV